MRPSPCCDKIEQVVRLIRSKGVGVYFVTQNPLDIPDTVLGQLGNRVQHALRAFTPRDQKAVKAAADTFRPNPALDTAQVITELGVGEALVSFLDEKGRPNIVERAFILPPASRIGPIDAAARQAVMASSLVAGVYEHAVDRQSAYEILTQRSTGAAPAAPCARRNHGARACANPGPAASAASSAAWAICSAAAAGATRPCRPWSSRPPAASAPRWDANSSVACWAPCSKNDSHRPMCCS